MHFYLIIHVYYNSDDSDEDIFLNEKEAQDEHEKFVLSYCNIVKTSAKIPEKMAKLLARRNRFSQIIVSHYLITIFYGCISNCILTMLSLRYKLGSIYCVVSKYILET